MTPTLDALRARLRVVAPALADGTIVPRGLEPSDDPEWCAASAVVDDRFVVKFAWSAPAAERIHYQARVLEALHAAAPHLPLPELVAASHEPPMVILRYVPADTFFAMRRHIGPSDRSTVAHDLASVLAQLHHPSLLRTVSRTISPLPARAVDAPDARHLGQAQTWCEWADEVLATPGRKALVHGDFHGDNHLWNGGRLRLIVDLETVGTGEPEFDLRCLPGDCGVELFLDVVAQYEQLTASRLDIARVMAWHVRTVLDDLIWRTRAGVPLPDGRSQSEWIDDLARRLAALNLC
ncbi:aminoglycoside phosphotransferase family protein [Actinoplanes sp. Pm04-4]|uniref:Aminoglycoside phosphotransferase family protein n=1 Tax=Paractinoplanes pyxinae TaxID=2997416 RepID=A0ABT4BGF7_9ACTN|nr:aminoglycoside phosphotransferase family protein [Actinoplanes pyxinae]MCY1145611.1 aminoglycoside phosphotransferase family protein [Actinoplanes pyxinae]